MTRFVELVHLRRNRLDHVAAVDTLGGRVAVLRGNGLGQAGKMIG